MNIVFVLTSLSLLLIARDARAAACSERFDRSELESLYTTKSQLTALLRESEAFDHHSSTTLRLWERGIRRELGHGLVYRGMAISTVDLDAILTNGLVVARTGYAGIFYSAEPAEAMSYAYRRLTEPALAALLALIYDSSAIVGRSVMTGENIPPEAIAAVVIFNPRGDPAFPFEIFKFSPKP